MTKRTRAVLNTYLETDDMPTQAQFIDLVDSSPNFENDGVIVGGTPNVTAFGGGGQANATVLTTLVSTITVCAAPGDSIKLPTARGGNVFAIVNATATSCNLYPDAGQEIMALGVNNPQAVAAGEVFLFASTGTGWGGGRLT